MPNSSTDPASADREARKRYVRKYLWRLGPATALAMTTVQLLLDDHPFGMNAIKRFVFVTLFGLIVGLPYYAYLLGRTWDKLKQQGRIPPSQ
jgi:hypothetical protein